MSDVHLAKIASIQRSVLRAREEFAAAGRDFGRDLTRQDAAMLNVLRACESAIDLAVLASIIGRDLDDLVRFSEWAARSL
jgi:hypothetical protein